MEKEEKVEELRDIIEMIHRFNATNQNGVFLFNFVGFNKEKTIDEDTDEEYYEIDSKKSTCGIFGDIETIRAILNEMRDIAEDYQDEDGFVSI